MKWRRASVTARDYPVRWFRRKLQVASYGLHYLSPRDARAKNETSYELPITFALVLSAGLLSPSVRAGDAPWVARGANGMVASEHAYARRMGWGGGPAQRRDGWGAIMMNAE